MPEAPTDRPWRAYALVRLALLAAAILVPSSPVAGASPSPTISPIPFPVDIAAGTYYENSAAGPRIVFRAPEDWNVWFHIPGAGFGLIDPGDPYEGGISMLAFDGHVYEDPCDARSLVWTEPSVRSFTDFLAAHELLRPRGEPLEVEVGGFSGHGLDVTAVVPVDCGAEGVGLAWTVPVLGPLIIEDGRNARIMALDVDGRVLVVMIEVFPGSDWDAFLPRAMEVLEGIDIERSAGASPEPSPTG